jgi:hypothetical protein
MLAASSSNIEAISSVKESFFQVIQQYGSIPVLSANTISLQTKELLHDLCEEINADQDKEVQVLILLEKFINLLANFSDLIDSGDIYDSCGSVTELVFHCQCNKYLGTSIRKSH